jgi:hypothetical protein
MLIVWTTIFAIEPDILLVRLDGDAAKPWLTVVLNDYSRAVAGYFLSLEDTVLQRRPVSKTNVMLVNLPGSTFTN